MYVYTLHIQWQVNILNWIQWNLLSAKMKLPSNKYYRLHITYLNWKEYSQLIKQQCLITYFLSGVALRCVSRWYARHLLTMTCTSGWHCRKHDANRRATLYDWEAFPVTNRAASVLSLGMAGREYHILSTVRVGIMLAGWGDTRSDQRTWGCVYSTCTDCNGLHELVSPRVCSHHQCQVGLFDQLVHCALETRMKSIHYLHPETASEMKFTGSTTWWQWHPGPGGWWQPHSGNKYGGAVLEDAYEAHLPQKC